MTTTEIDRFTESSLTMLPPAHRQADTSIAMLEAHDRMMNMAYNLASRMVKTTMVPLRFQGEDKTGDATAAILYGAELGLNPIQSLQRVIPIHGQPSLEARTMVALLQARGYKVKTIAQSDTSVTVRGRDLDGEEYETTWTIERALQAGYVPRPAKPDSQRRPDVDADWATVTKTFRNGGSKTSVIGNMKYITDPQAMLKAKAQSETCREIAPEILLGIGYTREDLESENWGEESAPRRVVSTRDNVFDADEVEDEPAPAKTGLADKIQPAAKPADTAPEPEVRPDPDEPDVAQDEPDADDTVEPEAAPADPETPGPAAPVPVPGAPTASTPGQTDRVSAALNKANKGGAAKAMAEMIDSTLAKVGVTDTDDVLAVASKALGFVVRDSSDLSLQQIKSVQDTVFAWKDLGTLEQMVTDAINSADQRNI